MAKIDSFENLKFKLNGGETHTKAAFKNKKIKLGDRRYRLVPMSPKSKANIYGRFEESWKSANSNVTCDFKDTDDNPQSLTSSGNVNSYHQKAILFNMRSKNVRKKINERLMSPIVASKKFLIIRRRRYS